MRRAIIFFGMISLLAASGAFATIIHVPEDYATIQNAIIAASDGDTVLVAPGNYYEDISFLGKDIHVKSSDGPSITAIRRDMYHGNYVVTFYAGETENAILEGFNIYGGWDQVIYCYNSSPTIYGNIISTHQNFPWDSCLIRIYSAQPTIRKNKIVGIDDWQAPLYGIHGTNSASAVIDSNDISVVGHGIFFQECNAITISRNIIHANGYGITANNLSDAGILNNSIVSNINTGLNFSGGGNNIILNNIIGFNNGWGIIGTTTDIVNYNDLWLNWQGNFSGIDPGANNVLADPLFLNLDSLDLRLQNGSLCIDNGDPTLPYDPDGTNSDMGAIFSDQRAIVIGHITDLFSAPISDVQIVVMPDGNAASSDFNGEFTLTGLTYGASYDLLFTHPNFADTVLIDICAAYDDTIYIDLIMGAIQEPGSISGIVTNLDGDPISDVLVTADISESSSTDQFGNYTLMNLEPRFYYISFDKPAFRDTIAFRVPVLAGQNTQLNVSLGGMALTVVQGIVSDENLMPMESIIVRIVTADEVTLTDESGYYRFDSIVGGAHIFNLYRFSFINTTFYDVHIPWDDTVEVNFALDIPCEFVPGDANGNGTTNGLDVGYLVQWFKGWYGAPNNICFCPPSGFIWAGADSNGDCIVNGLDISYMVNFLKGGPNFPRGCPSCE